MAGIDHTLGITKAVNSLIGEPVYKIVSALGLPVSQELPIPDHLVVSWIIIAGLSILSVVAVGRFKEVPETKTQHFFEFLVLAVYKLLDDVVGPKGRKFFAMIGALALFIFFGNIIGLVPFFKSPTNNLNTTVALALTIFVYYNAVAIKEQGFLKYMRHLCGPSPLLAPLMFPIEVIGHFARPLSLSIRLFGNIMGEDIILIILLMLVPWLVPLPMYCLAIFTSVLQTFIFIMLSCIYLAGAVATEHH